MPWIIDLAKRVQGGALITEWYYYSFDKILRLATGVSETSLYLLTGGTGFLQDM